MSWNGALYIDTVLLLGLKSDPKIFSAVSDTLEWTAIHEGVSILPHYLDDFLNMGRNSHPNTGTIS